MTEQLILCGADIIKVGISPGSVCTTRKKTGVDYPQLLPIMECADAAHGLGAHIIADGDCTVPGDICKAFGGGADFVILGMENIMVRHSFTNFYSITELKLFNQDSQPRYQLQHL